MNVQASKLTIHNLLTMPGSRSQRRFTFIFGAIVCLISLLSLPIASSKLPEFQAYQPAIFSTVICFELITAYVLFSQFLINRAPAVLVLGTGYLYSAGMSLMYMLVFPGIFSPTGLFHASSQTAPWMYILGHFGLPLALFLYMWLDHAYKAVELSAQRARQLVVLGISGTLFLIGLLTAVCLYGESLLPVLLSQGRLTPWFIYGFGLPIVLISLAALVVFYKISRGSTVTSAWLCVALLASMLDVAVVMCGGGRYSVGWYVAKLNTFVCANAVLSGMIYEFNKMYVEMSKLYRKVSESESNYKELLGESQLAERKIAEQKEIIERMLASSREAIVMCDSEGNVIFANRRFERLFEKPLLRGEKLAVYCSCLKAAQGSLSEMIEGYLQGRMKPFRERVSMVNSKEKTKYYECYVSPIANETDGTLLGHLFGFHDRTDEVRMVYYDELTGLPNRRYLGERLMEAMQQAKESKMLPVIYFMDLDGFKKVNDTYGHEMGDRLLQEVAGILQGCVGNRGICARWAGDEFIVLLNRLETEEQLEQIAQTIIQTINELDTVDGKEIHVTASIGVAIYPIDGTIGKTLLQHADQAMYEAKMRGKNNYCLYAAISEAQ
ncbi:diguanylate cyclase domain-containing protein [Paenibacillus roseipurpureus]|uniref:Diguanylate cyclase n=1 Tax=Paenibacillus roseopurpureus TaxID=2918901 RepID=A0AA96LMS1_9BACL|nr:diguanylate cyclase [Paenibacillus sp. MBLB1832]WNR44867.1 diguanylate cyclase [Paenibacillus sp. MBLB1832]